MSYITKMLGQPSSYAGIAATASAYAGTHAGTLGGNVALVVAGVCGLIAFFKDAKPSRL